MRNSLTFKLDVIGKLYACVMSPQFQPTFRFTAVLTEKVNPLILQKAVDDTLLRFPFMNMAMKNGFYWPCLHTSRTPVVPDDDLGQPFLPAPKPGELLRVRYHDRKISLEMQHVLADGYGAATFLRTLLAHYFILQGVPVAGMGGLLDDAGQAEPPEYEDSMLKYCRNTNLPAGREPQAYHVSPAPGNNIIYHNTVALTSARDIIDKAHGYGATVAEYIAAVLIQALQACQHVEAPEKPLPVKVSLSADLRRFYPSSTLRNFSYFANVGVSPGDLTFREILSAVHKQCQAFFTEPALQQRMRENLWIYKSLRFLPFIFKKPLVRRVYTALGERAFTAVLSNLGVFTLPEALQQRVAHIETMGQVSGNARLKCGVVTCGKVMAISFTNALGDARVEERFLAGLAGDGIPVAIEHSVRVDTENLAETKASLEAASLR